MKLFIYLYFAISADSEVRGEARGPRSERSSVSHNDDVSSTSSEKYERDVAILNSCFDDIERFIARLQHTAAATRELERRRRWAPYIYIYLICCD